MGGVPRVALAIKRGLDYEGAFIRGLARYMHAHGEWDIYTSNGLPILEPEEIGNWRGDGIIISMQISAELCDVLHAFGVQGVSVAGDTERSLLPRVIFDETATGRLAAEHFLDRGFRHFAYCGRMKDVWYSVRRADGYRHVLVEKGFSCSIFDSTPQQLAEGALERDEGLTEWLKFLVTPVGIFCSNDRFGHHVVRQCARLGILVPDEVAVLGLGNEIAICELTRPSLSSIPLNVVRLGYEAAALLDGLMRGRGSRREPILIPPEPVVTRQSTDALAIDDRAVVQAIRFIRERAAEPIYIEDVLRHVGLGRRTIERRFRERLGRSPAAEIIRVHWERAQRLLRETELPISQVAGMSGFASPGQMAGVFHRRCGMSPQSYRDQASG